MRIALTANGPGEVAGWLRPLLRSLYQRKPDLDVYVFLVPDDYATGFESKILRDEFPQARVYEPRSYLQFALGRKVAGVPDRVDLVQYVGGDLMHAARLHSRLKGRAATYRFSGRRYRTLFERAFAVDRANVEQLEGWGLPPERIVLVGNLAIDAALIESAAPAQAGTPVDGILIMPGSRAYELDNLIPFFFSVALRILRERPDLPIAIGLTPFTSRARVQSAIEGGGHERIFGRRGRLAGEDGQDYLESLDGAVRIPVLTNALAAAKQARLVLTIPGTKTVQVAALGTPAIAITPLNAPELVTVNGPLTYIDRIPLIGVPLKRAVAVGASRRYVHHAQPNIDAGSTLIREVHGTVTPGRIARLALEHYDDRDWIASTGNALAELYRDHAGAADRMTASLLELAA